MTGVNRFEILENSWMDDGLKWLSGILLADTGLGSKFIGDSLFTNWDCFCLDEIHGIMNAK